MAFSGRDSRNLQVYDPVLTNVARQFRPRGFVGDIVAPSIPVGMISGQYPIYDEKYFFSAEGSNKISDRTKVPRIELSWSTDTYLCEDYGLEVDITPRERQQALDALQLESSKTRFLVDQMKLRKEIRIAAVLKKTTNGGQLTGGTAATTVFATSTAIEADWKTSKLAVYNITGIEPNVAIVPFAKAYDMATNPTLRDIFKYQVNEAAAAFIKLGADENGEDIFLPRVFQGTRLVIPKGTLKQAGHEGAAKSFSDVWGTSTIFLYVDPNAGWGIPSTMYQFTHPTLTIQGDGGAGLVIDQYHENNPVLDVTRATECQDEKCCAPDLGFELTGC